MNEAANDPLDTSYPVMTWTWHDKKGGRLSTQIFSGGQIRQQRQFDAFDDVTTHMLGTIPTFQATAILARCREALQVGAPSNTAFPETVPGGETYQLDLAEGDHQTSSRQVSRAALSSDTALETIRGEVLGARKLVYRRWNIWTSAGARWFFLTMAVTLALGIYMMWDMKHDGQLQARAHTVIGTVVEQGGVAFKNEFLTVKLNAENAAPEVRIFKYLSHPHWEAAKVGSSVEVTYDTESGQGWLASDLLRWQSDKKTVWVVPGFLLLMAFVGLAWLRRYQIGVYGNGDEYMIHEDRVVTDDRDAPFSRSTLLWFKMFV